ncbi:hypothetical protein DID80_02980 [Candidatus Marinamargulisbacteria bacterium SCGC AAA071-K20]|nr:hypothetical protein DID80_02980 [Candidatus Marinamargulisbacteria bacterium SCGC AAA071-K20]
MDKNNKENLLYLVDCSEFKLKEPHGGKHNRTDEMLTVERGEASLYKINTKGKDILIDTPSIFIKTLKVVEKKMGVNFFK